MLVIGAPSWRARRPRSNQRLATWGFAAVFSLSALQLLRQVHANAHFLDGMQLRLEKIGVPLLVVNHLFEEVLRSGVSHFAAEFGGVVVLTHRAVFVGVGGLKLLHRGSDSGCQRNIQLTSVLDFMAIDQH